MRETPSQTAGPYVHIGCTPRITGITSIYAEDPGVSPIQEGAKGMIVDITGLVTDGSGAPVSDGVIETWQADADGNFLGQPNADPHVSGWARMALAADGTFTLKTVRPGRTSTQAPHIAFWLVARGLNAGLQTRMYFGDENNDDDLLLPKIPAERRDTLISRVINPNTHQFDIRLQGADETVFLDI